MHDNFIRVSIILPQAVELSSSASSHVSRIELIKEMRIEFSWGLKEAKDAVEEGVVFHDTPMGAEQAINYLKRLNDVQLRVVNGQKCRVAVDFWERPRPMPQPYQPTSMNRS